MNKTKSFIEKDMRTDLPKVSIGDTVRIYYKFTEKGKERTQPFEGVIIRKKGSDISETMTIRGSVSGVMIEKIIPVHSPKIEKIETIKKSKVRRAKLYYLRTAIGKKLRLKRKDEKKASATGEEELKEQEGVKESENKEEKSSDRTEETESTKN